MTAIATSASATQQSKSTPDAHLPSPFAQQSLTLPASFFASIPQPSSLFASLLSFQQLQQQNGQNAINQMAASAVQTPTGSTSAPHLNASKTTPPSVSPVPAGTYCDLGPAVFERTSRGYTVLRFEGYSFSKISDNRSKTYWRCANRTCRAKVHTNGGRIVYVGREPHVHKPRVAVPSNLGQKSRTPKSSKVCPLAGPGYQVENFQPTPANALDLRPKKECEDANFETAANIKVEECAHVDNASDQNQYDIDVEDDVELNIDDIDIEDSKEINQQVRGLPTREPSATPSTTDSSQASSPVKKPQRPSITSKMMTSPAVRHLPRSASEVELFRLLQRANLLGYYDIFLSRGGDDVQQLVEANEEEFAEILRLVDMASKPLHVRRFQKVLAEWHSNPSMFRVPISAADGKNHCVDMIPATPPHSAPTNVSSTTKSSTSSISPNPMAAGDAALSLMMMSGKMPVKTQSPEKSAMAPINLSMVSHTAYPTASSSSSSGSPSVYFLKKKTAAVGSNSTHLHNQQSEGRSSNSTSPIDSGACEYPDVSDSEASSFCSANLSESTSISHEPSSLLMVSTKPYPTSTLTPAFRELISRACHEQIARTPDLLKMTPLTEFPNGRMKIGDSQLLMNVLNMPRDDPNYPENVRKFSMIYGRFDTKRKNPDRCLSSHEFAVNEAAYSICLVIPALLTHREKLYQLARQAVSDACRSSSSSPSPVSNRGQHFATPPPINQGETKSLKRKANSSPSDQPIMEKQIRNGDTNMFPDSASSALTATRDEHSNGSSASGDNEKNTIAMALAKQLGFSELAQELQKDHDEASQMIQEND